MVRAAAPGGGAEAAGVETGSLLVALDGKSTKVRRFEDGEAACRCCRSIDRWASVSSLVVFFLESCDGVFVIDCFAFITSGGVTYLWGG